MGRCTSCGRYPFCCFIKEDEVGKDNNCQVYIKRSLGDGEINKICKFRTGKEDSKIFGSKTNSK